MRTITFGGIATRFVVALALVCLTWNPTRYNYYEWALAQWSANTPIVALVGVALLIAWVVFVRATTQSLGFVGIVLAVGLMATVFWALLFYGILDAASDNLLIWIALLAFAALLAIGMSWSHLRRAWTGQIDVDDVDEP